MAGGENGWVHVVNGGLGPWTWATRRTVWATGPLTWWLVVALAIVLAAGPSCSVADDLLDREAQVPLGSEVVDPLTPSDVETETGLAIGEEDVSGEPSIWVRGEDAAMRPDSPLAVTRAMLPPGNGQGWSAIGYLFDFATGTSRPVEWQADDPTDRDSWVRGDLPVDNGEDAGDVVDAVPFAAVRADGFDVLVGGHGQGLDQRPAVWLRTEGDRWRPIDWSQLDRGSTEWLDDVAVDPATGLVIAVGNQQDETGGIRPVLWVSPDGDTWDPVDDVPFSEGGTESLHGLAAGPTATVLTGSVADGPLSAAAFWSADGRTWTTADVETPGNGGRSYLREVAWFNDRFVAVGGVAADREGTDEVYQPASWTSLDGKVWELQPTPFELLGARISSAGFGAQRVVAGDSMLYASATRAFVQQLWQSADGTTWTLAGDIEDIRPDEGFGVLSLAVADGLVLSATDEPGVAVYNGDRHRFAPVPPDLLPVPERSPWVSDVDYVGGRWVAVGGASVQVGTNGAGGIGEYAMWWTSTDGTSWEVGDRLPETSTGSAIDGAPTADGLIAVGAESLRSSSTKRRFGRGLMWQLADGAWDERNSPAAIETGARIGLLHAAVAGNDLLFGGWRFTVATADVDALLIEQRAGGEPQRVDVGHSGADDERIRGLCGAEDGTAVALVWLYSPDGSKVAALNRSADGEWSDADWPDTPGATDTVLECVHGVDGFLAAGSIDTSETGNDVGLWRSTDGTTWERVTGPEGFSLPGDQSLSSLVATEDGYLLVGSDASSGEPIPHVWFGSGDTWDVLTVDAAPSMTNLDIAYGGGTIVVIGWSSGEQVYTTTLDQLTDRQRSSNDE